MWADAEFPADPYPGAVPPASFVHVDGTAQALVPGPTGWTVSGTDLDGWLAAHGAAPVAARVPVLTYGSNRCPSKITWLRETLGLGADPVVVLRARTTGVAAVWAAGLRVRDGQRPAVLALDHGAVEEHAVWLATPAQVAVLDRCEGRGRRYRLARLRCGTVRTEDGVLVDGPWCYLGSADIRRPLLVDGRPVRCVDVAQAAALQLCGVPALDDGLIAETVTGVPRPDEWPAALFAYGLLQPGGSGWAMVAPHAAGPARAATVPGAILDTGRGYPAWLPGGAGRARGTVVPLHDPATLLPVLDRFEGPDYVRTRIVLPADGTVCWAYAWRSATTGFVELPGGWPLPDPAEAPEPV